MVASLAQAKKIRKETVTLRFHAAKLWLVLEHLSKNVSFHLLMLDKNMRVVLWILMTLPRGGVPQKFIQTEHMSLAKVNGDTATALAQLIQLMVS